MQNRPTVFYVDDNPSSRRLLTGVFRESSFEVITASGPIEALDRSRNICFDLALVDYQMPFMSGSELAQEMKFIHPHIPVVMISGCVVLPAAELRFVDAHFGSGTALDDLITAMRMLLSSKPPSAASAGRASQWADLT